MKISAQVFFLCSHNFTIIKFCQLYDFSSSKAISIWFPTAIKQEGDPSVIYSLAGLKSIEVDTVFVHSLFWIMEKKGSKIEIIHCSSILLLQYISKKHNEKIEYFCLEISYTLREMHNSYSNSTNNISQEIFFYFVFGQPRCNGNYGVKYFSNFFFWKIQDEV